MTGFNTQNGFFSFFFKGDKPCCDLQWSSNGYSQHTATHTPYTPERSAVVSPLLPLGSPSSPPCPVSPRWLSKRLIDCCLLPGWAEGSAVRQSPQLKGTACQRRQNRTARAVDIGEHQWEFSGVRQFWAMFCCQIRFCLGLGPRKHSDVSLKASDSIFLINESSDGVDHLFQNWLEKANRRMFLPDDQFCCPAW